MANDDQILLRRVRTRQIVFITVGVVTSLGPPLAISFEAYGAAITVTTLAAWILVPIAYFLFVAGFEEAVERHATAPKTVKGSLRAMAAATVVPGLGSLIEVALLYRLAKESTRLPGARDRSGLVLALAFSRLFAGVLVTPFLGFLFSMFEDAWIVFLVMNPLFNLAVLAVITQIVVTPLLDQMMPESDGVNLAAAGAGTPMAVSSQSRRPEDG